MSSMNEKDIMCLVLIANPIINWCFFFIFYKYRFGTVIEKKKRYPTLHRHRVRASDIC